MICRVDVVEDGSMLLVMGRPRRLRRRDIDMAVLNSIHLPPQRTIHQSFERERGGGRKNVERKLQSEGFIPSSSFPPSNPLPRHALLLLLLGNTTCSHWKFQWTTNTSPVWQLAVKQSVLQIYILTYAIKLWRKMCIGGQIERWNKNLKCIADCKPYLFRLLVRGNMYIIWRSG